VAIFIGVLTPVAMWWFGFSGFFLRLSTSWTCKCLCSLPLSGYSSGWPMDLGFTNCGCWWLDWFCKSIPKSMIQSTVLSNWITAWGNSLSCYCLCCYSKYAYSFRVNSW
jgi:hypothetical protein